MKNKHFNNIKFLLSVFIILNSFGFSQINFFNFYKSYQANLCCPYNVYGLGLQINYLIIDINTAELQIPVDLYWGIMENMEVGVQFAGVSRSYSDEIHKSVSDLLLGTKFNFLKESQLSTYPSVTCEIGLSLPTGDYKKGFGTGGVGFILWWLFEKEIVLKSNYYFNLLLSLGYKYNTTNPDDYRVGESLYYNFGSNFDVKENFNFSFGVKGENKKSDEFKNQNVLNTEKFESYFYCGINYSLDMYRMFFGSISVGITDDAKDLVFNLGMMY